MALSCVVIPWSSLAFTAALEQMAAVLSLNDRNVAKRGLASVGPRWTELEPEKSFLIVSLSILWLDLTWSAANLKNFESIEI